MLLYNYDEEHSLCLPSYTMNKKFERTIEDFVCEHCGREVKGNGYTNHCPQCLWSKHVDINPGDRREECKGLMQPSQVTLKEGEYVILHKCIRCGFTRNNKTVKEDNFDTLVKIVKGV